jgi:hypothetical protein
MRLLGILLESHFEQFYQIDSPKNYFGEATKNALSLNVAILNISLGLSTILIMFI